MKDKRLQIRVTAEELEGINRRAQEVGLSVAEYGRTRLLAGNVPLSEGPMRLNLDLEPAYPRDDDGPNYDRADDSEECDVTDVPTGVRCIKCGMIHGS